MSDPVNIYRARDTLTTDKPVFGREIGPPFKQIGVREIYDEPYNQPSKRLTDDEIKELIKNPRIQKPTRLKDLSRDANREATQIKEEEKIYNMSVKQIAYNTSDAMTDILNETLSGSWSKHGVDGLLRVLTKQDRLIYIGIVMIMISILSLLIRTVK